MASEPSSRGEERRDRGRAPNVEVLLADITTLDVDAVVNAANKSLAGGGGVDGAIHRAAGPKLHEECKALGGCATGKAKITAGYNLPARHVIHAVGPVWNGGDANEDALLASCYREAIELARERGLRSIAFPSISTGIYGFPADRAARIAVTTVTDELARNPASLERVIFCCFDTRAADLHQAALTRGEEVLR
jgi:O-acetyl-ADP-ribose deacetylase (regulator of RNase III)